MTWKDKLTANEREELARAERTRNAARETYNATRLKLKARCESRIRAEREAAKKGDGDE